MGTDDADDDDDDDDNDDDADDTKLLGAKPAAGFLTALSLNPEREALRLLLLFRYGKRADQADYDRYVRKLLVLASQRSIIVDVFIIYFGYY